MGAGKAIAAIVGVLLCVTGTACAAPSAHAGHCLKALAPLLQGAAPLSANFTATDCAGPTVAAAFRHDAARGVTLAARNISADEIVPAYPEYGADIVMPGQVLHLVVRSGAARIERQVEALQPARPGQRLFVRSQDGEIISVRYRRSGP